MAIACADEAEAAAVANRKAPEHLELAMRYPEALQKELRNYGSLFVGHQAAEALGDFSAGINHSLPTAGAARYTGGLSVKDFVKLVTVFRAKQGAGYERAAKAAVLLAQAEGLAAHVGAAAARIKA
jgi:histidinol dehydrogenase